MSTIQLIISDLHLADGTSILDCFGDRQQAAFEGLLAAPSSLDSPLSQAEHVELIINGDCFDFLVTTPYNSNKTTNAATAVHKIDRIIAAHRPFFSVLHRFIAHPGRRVTFITGNHDFELCFAEVRQRITAAIIENDQTSEDERVYFCPTRFYRPVPAIYIEHGNNYDFWNHAILGIWDERGQPLDRHPETLNLSVGSRYFQSASHVISTQHAYFDHFDPSINSTRQIALLCLLNPELLIQVAQDTMHMLSYPRQSLANLSLVDRRNPVQLFEEVMQDFVAFQTDMAKQKQDWTPIASYAETTSISQEDITAFVTTRETLSLPITEAVAFLCTPAPSSMGEGVATGMQHVLENDPSLRYAVAGHTHQVRFNQASDGTSQPQVYFNTGSWTTHLALPRPEEVTPALVAWLRAPDWNAVPLRNITQFPFVLVTSATDALPTVQLCAWEGGTHGNYHVLA
ncbi:MAG: hypothetical protein PVS3B3_00170 [Ktedonobacteraceae bacterium]